MRTVIVQWEYEDQLPDDMTDEQYDAMFRIVHKANCANPVHREGKCGKETDHASTVADYIREYMTALEQEYPDGVWRRK